MEREHWTYLLHGYGVYGWNAIGISEQLLSISLFRSPSQTNTLCLSLSFSFVLSKTWRH